MASLSSMIKSISTAGALIKPKLEPGQTAAAAPGPSSYVAPSSPTSRPGMSPTLKYALIGGGALGLLAVVLIVKKKARKKNPARYRRRTRRRRR
jgi:hypothetical protein